MLHMIQVFLILMQEHARNSTLQTVERDVEHIYGKYAPFQFLAYWYVYHTRKFNFLLNTIFFIVCYNAFVILLH